MSHEAYAKAQNSNPRTVEYRAFAKATRALLDIAETGNEDIKTLVEAVHVNRSLWGALASDCSNDDNLLPVETRASIIALSRWVSSYSSEVVRKKESIDPLIDVNRIMMDGLAGKTES